MSDLAKQLIIEAAEKKSTFLDLGNCGLTSIPSEIEMLADHLEKLSLGSWYWHQGKYVPSKNKELKNNFSKRDKSFRSLLVMYKLQSLDIVTCEIDSEAIILIGRIYSLKSLRLNASRISTLAFVALTLLANLTEIDLSYCSLKSDVLDLLDRLTELRQLSLSGNQLTSTNINAILRLSNLQHLELSSCLLTDHDLLNLSTLTQLTYLDITGNQISDQGVQKINQLQHLRKLNIAHNFIGDMGIITVSALPQLKVLDASGNHISQFGIQTFAGLPYLEELMINDNSIDDIDIETIIKIPGLRRLHISNNRLTDAGIQMLSTGATNITDLDVSNNALSDSSAIAISKLSMLTRLGFSSNTLTESGARALTSLTNLTNLDVGYNNIGDEGLKFICTLANLKILNVSKNNISDIGISYIDNLNSLQELYLGHNKISIVKPLGKLVHLSRLHLDDNKIANSEQLDFVKHFPALLHLKINENPFLQTYDLALDQNHNHLPDIKELVERNADPSPRELFRHPVKILVLGNHAAGKSSLVNKLVQGDSKGSTHILRIQNYTINPVAEQISLDAIFFDFGGQDIYHGIYQAFISDSALQLVLFNGAGDRNTTTVDAKGVPIINFNRHYWLGQKRYQDREYGAPTPYIMIQTHVDNDAILSPNINYELYPGYLQSFHLSLSNEYNDEQQIFLPFYESSLSYFENYLKLLIHTMQKATEREEPLWYINFMEKILLRKTYDHMPILINELVTDFGLDSRKMEKKVESIKVYLANMHRHGLVLYYKRAGLDDIVWLNPQKLVEHIQEHILTKELFLNSQNKSPGVLKRKVFESQVADDKITLLLREQKIIFLHRPTGQAEDEEYIIPNFLPLLDKSRADMKLFTFGLGKPCFILKFCDFIPFGFINQLICFFGKQPDVKQFWRNQLLFTLEDKARILIELDFETLKIKVHVQMLDSSDSTTKNNISTYLFYSMLCLYWNIPDDKIPSLLQSPRYNDDKRSFIDLMENYLSGSTNYAPTDLYISIDDKQYIKYTDLTKLNNEDYKIKAYTKDGEDNINEHDVELVTTLPFIPFATNRLNAMKKVFIAYSKYDDAYLTEFEDHLVTLKEEGVATFNCRKIDFGKEWDPEIKKQLDEADIMICLVSVNFLNTAYVMNIEVPRAIVQNKIIVPIIIRACDWETSSVGKYQATQRGKIVTLNNDELLLGKIQGYSREERDASWLNIIREFRQKKLFG